MRGLNREGRRFLGDYHARFSDAEHAAKIACGLVKQIAGDTGLLLHVVSARAKTLNSLREKLIEKQYRRPDDDLTDLIGVRVITYYRDAVDPIADRLRQSFDINAAKSVDKRLSLDLREFGYRSVHLIARLRPDQMRMPGDGFLRDRWFEIQVRSLLEHAWAEIEHEVIYKSGIEFPNVVLRRFGALAGGMELFDNEFVTLREERSTLVGSYRSVYERGGDQRVTFDVARLQAFLEATRTGLSWRQARESGRPLRSSWRRAA